jgi:hypothetical protein
MCLFFIDTIVAVINDDGTVIALVYDNTASISTDIIILCVASIIKLYYTLGATYKSVLLQAIHSRVIPLEASHMINKSTCTNKINTIFVLHHKTSIKNRHYNNRRYSLFILTANKTLLYFTYQLALTC